VTEPRDSWAYKAITHRLGCLLPPVPHRITLYFSYLARPALSCALTYTQKTTQRPIGSAADVPPLSTIHCHVRRPARRHFSIAGKKARRLCNLTAHALRYNSPCISALGRPATRHALRPQQTACALHKSRSPPPAPTPACISAHPPGRSICPARCTWRFDGSLALHHCHHRRRLRGPLPPRYRYRPAAQGTEYAARSTAALRGPPTLSVRPTQTLTGTTCLAAGPGLPSRSAAVGDLQWPCHPV